jgi:hypothetical protein
MTASPSRCGQQNPERLLRLSLCSARNPQGNAQSVGPGFTPDAQPTPETGFSPQGTFSATPEQHQPTPSIHLRTKLSRIQRKPRTHMPRLGLLHCRQRPHAANRLQTSRADGVDRVVWIVPVKKRLSLDEHFCSLFNLKILTKPPPFPQSPTDPSHKHSHSPRTAGMRVPPAFPQPDGFPASVFARLPLLWLLTTFLPRPVRPKNLSLPATLTKQTK